MDAVFVQPGPRLENTWRSDGLLRSYLARKLPPEMYARIAVELDELGALAAGPLADQQRAERAIEPRLTHWDPWGERIDQIDLTPLWREAERLTTRLGLTALPFERRDGAWSRTHQFALVHLFHPVTDMYTCPLAMTDGAARTLIASGNRELVERAVPRLTSRDPQAFWTSGQWMTESTGGSDVGGTQTQARRDANGLWRLYGKKWFTSAATSQMALTLARPEGGKSGGSGLALFYVETRDSHGKLRHIRVERLKDKLGTRKVPTAELTLDGTPAMLVAEESGGTRAIEPMLRITRTWNSVCAESFMRYGLTLAQDYARRRRAFGATLADQPLHRATLAMVEAQAAGAFLLTFLLVELVGKDECGELDKPDAALLRVLTPLTKLMTGKQVVEGVSEIIEAFGGAGYVEDTGLPVLLRDAQVLPIWEGTTNVLALDLLLRADLARGVPALEAKVAALVQAAGDAGLADAANEARGAARRAREWLQGATNRNDAEAGARRFAFTLGYALELALLVDHAAATADEAQREQLVESCRQFMATRRL